MLFNIDWLRDYVEIDITAEELAVKLTMLGHEVDEVKHDNGFDILDIDLTPNRSDCMNHLGLAREIAALFRKELKMPATDYPEAKKKSEDHLTIKIDAPENTHRFAGNVVLNAKISKSPDWLAKRLESVGVRSVNNMVDITNYVLFETGHPMHAYDLGLLSGKTLITRDAKKGEKMTTLDGEERKLEAGDILITDAQKIVGLGGIMGGENTEIHDKSVSIALEAAWFNPVQIRKTSKRLALSTDASYRFERIADIEGPAFAVDRCCHLISKVMKGEILEGVIDEYPNKQTENVISFRPERARKIIGQEITNDEIALILKDLNIQVGSSNQYRWKVVPPSYRSDLDLEVDIIEEVARYFGYDKIAPSMPPFKLGARAPLPVQRIKKETRDRMVACGLQQIISYSFTSAAENEIFGTPAEDAVKILNPIADDMDYLRASLLPSLVKAASLNYNYGNHDTALFETGTVFRKAARDAPEENLMLGIILTGKDYPVHWKREAGEYDFHSLKGILESLPLIDRLEITYKQKSISYFSSEDFAGVYHGNKEIGRFGRLSDDVLKKFDLGFNVFAAEVNLTALAEIGEPEFVYESVSRFQPVIRDIALIIDESVEYSDLLYHIRNLKIETLRDINIFDLYHGEKIPAGKKSIALKLLYTNSVRNFTGEEIADLQAKVIESLKDTFSVIIQEK